MKAKSPAKHKKICIDFDGVLAQYRGWKGNHHGKPALGVKRFLKRLVAANIDFVVLTTRDSKKAILKWFKKHNLPLPLNITNKKIKATAYVDDRAVYFDGSFTNLIKKLSKFEVYWKKGMSLKSLSKTK